MVNYLLDEEVPEVLRKFLIHTRTIQNRSQKTSDEYYLDLRLFFRFLKKYKQNLQEDIDNIDISDVNLEFIKDITIDDAHNFLAYLANDRVRFHKSPHSELGISARSRSRKVSSLRSFFKFLVDKTKMLETNPIANLDIPQKSKHLPKYLTFDESVELINSIDGKFRERDLCIILIFLSCGLRVSELVRINLNDINDLALKIRGKGDKERIVYLNQPCIEAIDEYLKVRIQPSEADKNALFISRQGNRINVQTVKWIVKKSIKQSDINRDDISVHKLRHTAATMMYANGLDIRTLQEVLGHECLETTKIYTHIDNSNLREAAKINPMSNIEIPKNKKTTN